MRDEEKARVDELVKLFPGPITLTERPISPVLIMVMSAIWIVASLAFVYSGIVHGIRSQIIGGVLSALLGVLVIVIAPRRADLSQLPTLVLDSDGFRTGPNSAFAWQDGWTFCTASSEGPDEVSFASIDSDDRPFRGRQRQRLPSCYGMSAAALTSLLDRWSDAAWRQRNPPKYKNPAPDQSQRKDPPRIP
ncbi:hypothetical protein A5634_19270 [Mycobacterium asiaticum]|uniref:Uncharacterized protein n=1 Tax=Mycobacterium asiaticum TaxID=1790 RepID=A0A1A3P6L6_MYCAS|nr:hypothetical protein [Mycobacterium asiaticum]OBK28949.1 hypothetical protein A5634_19270 [Mycobacterium asiaticum]